MSEEHSQAEQLVTIKEHRPPAQLDGNDPSAERRAELEAAYSSNLRAGKPPYADVWIRTLGELGWIVQTRGWSSDPAELSSQEPGTRPDLREASLRGAVLDGARLRGARLTGADLSHASLDKADLQQARLRGAILVGASLREADLRFAKLDQADLGGATLTGADLRGARLDEKTWLDAITLDNTTWVGDVFWSSAALTRIRWEQAPRLGDEQAISQAQTREEQIMACREAARAYRGLAVALRAQGLTSVASSYRLREQRLERQALRYQRKYGSWLFSGLLDLVAGYGEEPGRILLAYLAVVLGFAAAYWSVTHLLDTKLAQLSWDQALVLSLTSFHGRGFFPGFLSLGDWVARLGAAEAVIGLFIELILIATFSKRFLSS
jgi:hypothetical protein